jgi:transketolase
MDRLFPGLDVGPAPRETFDAVVGVGERHGPGEGRVLELELDAIEGLARACEAPGARVAVPADAAQMEAVVRVAEGVTGAVIRVDRRPAPEVYDAPPAFEFGRADRLRDGSDVTIIATGLMVAAAVVAHNRLLEMGVRARVVNMASLRPVDTAAIEAAARETGAIVTAEEALLEPGLASAVATVVAARHPVPMEHLGLDEAVEWSGGADALLEYGLTAAHIMGRVHDVMERKARP